MLIYNWLLFLLFACLLSVSFANICIFCETATGFLSGKCLRAVCGAGVAENFTPSHNRIGLSALCFYGIGPFYASGFRGRGKCSSLQKAKRLLPASRLLLVSCAQTNAGNNRITQMIFFIMRLFCKCVNVDMLIR